MDSALPLLAPPSGDTLKFRKRNNDLDEREEEALRVQIRQHIGASVSHTKSARTGRQQQHDDDYRDGRSHSTASDTAALTGGGTVLDATSLRAMWSSSTASLCSVSEMLKLVQRVFWFADEDMAEEIDESDPKIQAGKKFLAGIEAFAMLTENELAQLVGLAEFRAYHGGETVVEDERDADGLYIVPTGAAARFISSNAAMDGDDGTASSSSQTDTFGYQEHFGIVVSPTEATSVERVETTVVATSDVLECIWLPELAVRMLNIQPRLEHEFALILHNHRGGQSIEERRRSQEDILLRLLRAGVHVTVLANTRNTTHTIVLLLSAPLWLLARRQAHGHGAHHREPCRGRQHSGLPRWRRLRVPRRDHDGVRPHRRVRVHPDAARDGQAPGRRAPWHRAQPGPDRARRVPAARPEYDGFHPLDLVQGDPLGVHQAAVSAAHQGLLWAPHRVLHGVRAALQRHARVPAQRRRRAVGFLALDPLPVVRSGTRHLRALHRVHLGAVVPQALEAVRELAARRVELAWHQGDRADEPPEFRDYVVETINVAGEGEPPDYVEVKTYDHRRRWPKYAIFALFCTICLVLLFVFVGVYVQWYIIAVMTPMCTDPRYPEFLDAKGADGSGCVAHCNELFAQGKSYLFMERIHSCTQYCDSAMFDREYYRCNPSLVDCFHTERGIVGTARWFYVLVQGIVLGLTLDIVFLAIFEAIALAFNRWENYQTEQEREKRSIEKIFLFNWVGYFYWFFLFAFVYMPNGDDVQQFVQAHVDRNWVFSWNQNVRFSRYWVDGLISMDSAFVTPMIVTQALNLVINTFVPYLLRRALIRTRDSYHVKKEQLFQTALKSKRRSGKPPGSKGADSVHASEVSLEASSSSYGGDLNLIDSTVLSDTTGRWIHVTEQQQMNRDEVRRLLAEREPIAASELEGAVRDLFRSLSSHDNHMHEICGGLAKDDLDAYQVTSYDWLDRVTRSIEDAGHLKSFWDAADAPTAPSPPASGLPDSSRAAKSMKLRLITQWQCRNYNYTADRILEESSMPTYSPFGDLLHLAIQFSYTIMFSVVLPFCCLCLFCRNAVALRFDAIKMTIDCKRPVPRRTVGIGSWLGAFMFEIAVAQIVVPALFVYVSGQLDAFFHECEISEAQYGPATAWLSASDRFAAFSSLENVGIAICLLVYWKKSDMSSETTIKTVAHSRRLRHNLRQSVRMIGETILVRTQQSHATWKSKAHRGGRLEPPASDVSGSMEPTAMFAVNLDADDHQPAPPSCSSSFHSRQRRGNSAVGGDRTAGSTRTQSHLTPLPEHEQFGGEWREGTVSWVTNGRIKVNFSGGRQLASGDGGAHHALTYAHINEHDVWFQPSEAHVLMDPTPVEMFRVGMPVLLASKKFGCWLEATVTGVDDKDQFGNHVAHAPNEMHFRVVEAQNLRSLSARRLHAAAIDPYCVVTVGTLLRHATSVKRRAVNPVWDEVVEFPLSERDLYGSSSTAANAPSANASAARQTAPLIHPLERTGATGGSKGVRGVSVGSAVLRTVKASVFNNDPFALSECLGEVEIDLNQFRDGAKHRVLMPLSHKRHIWTLEAIESVMRRQALDYPVLGIPHLLLELQWIDTRLPTKVAVRVRGPQPPAHELVLSRKFCETNLCYGLAFGATS